MKKIMFLLTFVLLLTMVFTGCTGKSSTEKYDNNSELTDLKINEIKQQRLTYPHDVEMMFSSVITLENVKDEVESLCTRCNNGVYYAVARTGEDDYLFMLFDSELRLNDAMTVQKLTEKNNYKNIKENVSTSKDITKIDKGTKLIENFDGKSENAVSYHRFTDGTMLVINYKKSGEKWIVNKLTFKDDPSKLISCLLPKDLAAIS